MPFLRQTSEGVVLIELLQQRVQLVCAAHDTVNPRWLRPRFFFCLFLVLVGLVRFRHALDHIRHHGVELGGVLRCDGGPPGVRFDGTPCVSRHLAAAPGNDPAFLKALWLGP